MLRAFERVLWASRLLVVVAVVAGVVLDRRGGRIPLPRSSRRIRRPLPRPGAPAQYNELRSETVTTIVKALDGFLIGALLLLFAFGLYELFVGNIRAAEGDEAAPRLLVVSSLDDLKEKVARLVLLVLVIEFFQRALGLSYERVLDLLYLAAGILLVSGALYLSGLRSPARAETEKPGGSDL